MCWKKRQTGDSAVVLVTPAVRSVRKWILHIYLGLRLIPGLDTWRNQGIVPAILYLVTTVVLPMLM